MNVMVYNYDSLSMHLFVAYHKRIAKGQFTNMTLREGFTETTEHGLSDRENCYTPAELLAIAERHGFARGVPGAAISNEELIVAPSRFKPIQERRLPEECRGFCWWPSKPIGTAIQLIMVISRGSTPATAFGSPRPEKSRAGVGRA